MPDLTLLQISDLHFSAIDRGTGQPVRNPLAVKLWSHTSRFDGALGHHNRALQHLHHFYWSLRRAGENPEVVVTGDVTAYGSGEQFDSADDFLVSQINLSPQIGINNWVGLHVNDWRKRAIPGNHDHWPGKPTMFGRPTTALQTCFPPAEMPAAGVTFNLGGGCTLRLVAINTDANVLPFSPQRILAIGSFQGELNHVAGLLQAPNPNELRVLLMHHSWHHYGPTLHIDQGSRSALGDFLLDFGISVVLTGHTHSPIAQMFPPQESVASDVLECRCGTTTQIDTVPYDWRTLWGKRPKRTLPRNTLLLHRISESGGEVTWRVHPYVRLRSGFKPLINDPGQIPQYVVWRANAQ